MVNFYISLTRPKDLLNRLITNYYHVSSLFTFVIRHPTTN